MHHIRLIDGPHRGERMTDTSDRPAPVRGETIEVEGTEYTFIGEVSVDLDHDPAIGMHLATADPLELLLWFDSLLPGTRSRLATDPHGPVPPELVSEIISKGELVSGTFLAGASTDPDGYLLPYEIMDWIDRHYESRANRTDMRCPDCGGSWQRNFDFDHTGDCELGNTDRERSETAHPGVRGATSEELHLADALGKPPVAASYRNQFDPIPPSDPHLTRTTIDDDGTVHRIVDGFNPDVLHHVSD